MQLQPSLFHFTLSQGLQGILQEIQSWWKMKKLKRSSEIMFLALPRYYGKCWSSTEKKICFAQAKAKMD